MAMDFVEAAPLDVLATMPQGRRNAVGTLFERLLFRELFEFRVMQTDPNFANYLYQPKSGRLVLLDFGATRHFGAEFVANYARITRAVIDGDRAAVAREAVASAMSAADDSPRAHRGGGRHVPAACANRCAIVGRYDFGASNLPARVRKLGFELAVRRRLLQPPPPETLFLHRKLVGSFLLLARLGAQVDARSLVLPLLAKE